MNQDTTAVQLCLTTLQILFAHSAARKINHQTAAKKKMQGKPRKSADMLESADEESLPVVNKQHPGIT